jgi:hypothetical protein
MAGFALTGLLAPQALRRMMAQLTSTILREFYVGGFHRMMCGENYESRLAIA